MTVMQQRIANRITSLSDEGLAIIDQFINSLNPSFFTSQIISDAATPVSSLQRFGIAKGKLSECDDFDCWNDEIADMFAGKRE